MIDFSFFFPFVFILFYPFSPSVFFWWRWLLFASTVSKNTLSGTGCQDEVRINVTLYSISKKKSALLLPLNDNINVRLTTVTELMLSFSVVERTVLRDTTHNVGVME